MEASDRGVNTSYSDFVSEVRKRIEAKHGKSADELWDERNKRITDAIDLKEPDRVPVGLFFLDFPVGYAGLSPTAPYYEPDAYRRAFVNMIADIEPDMCNTPEGFAIISGNGLAALETTQLHWPGGDLPEDSDYQFIDGTTLLPEEYDLFITDPTDFMLRYYLPRRFGALSPLSQKLFPLGQSLAGNAPGFFWMSPTLAGDDFRRMAQRVVEAGREQAGFGGLGEVEELGFPLWFYPGGACSIYPGGTSQPFDWIADQLRGMKGIVEDMFKRPEKLLLACERVLEWRLARALPADPSERGYPRRVLGGVTHWSFDSFLSKSQFETFCWPTWKRALTATIELGFIPYVYFEGVCDSRVEYFLELPKGKTLLHFERSDMARAKAILRDHACICAEVPPSLLQMGSSQEVDEFCRDLIETCGKGGGLILGAEAGLTRRAKLENVRAMVESVKKYG